jgi:hypothetical protein
MAQPENGIAAPTAVTGSFYHWTDIPGLEATRPACRATVPRPWRRLGQSDHPAEPLLGSWLAADRRCLQGCIQRTIAGEGK